MRGGGRGEGREGTSIPPCGSTLICLWLSSASCSVSREGEANPGRDILFDSYSPLCSQASRELCREEVCRDL